MLASIELQQLEFIYNSQQIIYPVAVVLDKLVERSNADNINRTLDQNNNNNDDKKICRRRTSWVVSNNLCVYSPGARAHSP